MKQQDSTHWEFLSIEKQSQFLLLLTRSQGKQDSHLHLPSAFSMSISRCIALLVAQDPPSCGIALSSPSLAENNKYELLPGLPQFSPKGLTCISSYSTLTQGSSYCHPYSSSTTAIRTHPALLPSVLIQHDCHPCSSSTPGIHPVGR